MNDIIISKEILDMYYNMDRDEDGHPIYYEWSVKDTMIEFAKLHVEAALEAASSKSYTESIYTGRQFGMQSRVNKNSILNAYPLENIK